MKVILIKLFCVSAVSLAAGGNYKDGLCLIENNLDVYCESGTDNGVITTNNDIFLTDDQAIFIVGDKSIVFE